MFSFQMTIKLKEAEDAIVTLLHSLPRAHPFRALLSIAAKAKPTTAARLLQSSATTHTASLWLQDGQLLDLLLRRTEEAELPLEQETRKVLEMLRLPLAASPVVGH